MLIRRGVGSERRLINGGMKSAERAKTLVQRLLAFSRRQPLQVNAIDVSALMSGMADLLSSTLGPRIKVTVDIEADLRTVRADPHQLEMAILNLRGRDGRHAAPLTRLGSALRICARSASLASISE